MLEADNPAFPDASVAEGMQSLRHNLTQRTDTRHRVEKSIVVLIRDNHLVPL